MRPILGAVASSVVTLGFVASATGASASLPEMLGSRVTPHAVPARPPTQRTSAAVYRAPFPDTRIVTAHYVYWPPPQPNPSPAADPDACQDTGTNCTPEQLCELWGEC